jgi:hypothetical protein
LALYGWYCQGGRPENNFCLGESFKKGIPSEKV